MATFLVVYKGGGEMPSTPEAQQAAMTAWTGWFGGLGAAVIDGGNPFGGSVGIAPDGTVTPGAGAGLTGYSLLSADSLASATTMAQGCPILAGGGSVELYEAVNMM
jgi:hypothetical protein